MQFTLATIAAVALALTASAAPYNKRAQWDQYVQNADFLSMSCTQNITDGTIDMFWSTQGFATVNSVLLESENDRTTVPLVKTGGGFGFIDFAGLGANFTSGGPVIIGAQNVTDPATKEIVPISFCILNTVPILDSTSTDAQPEAAAPVAASVSSSFTLINPSLTATAGAGATSSC